MDTCVLYELCDDSYKGDLETDKTDITDLTDESDTKSFPTDFPTELDYQGDMNITTLQNRTCGALGRKDGQVVCDPLNRVVVLRTRFVMVCPRNIRYAFSTVWILLQFSRCKITLMKLM